MLREITEEPVVIEKLEIEQNEDGIDIEDRILKYRSDVTDALLDNFHFSCC